MVRRRVVKRMEVTEALEKERREWWARWKVGKEMEGEDWQAGDAEEMAKMGLKDGEAWRIGMDGKVEERRCVWRRCWVDGGHGGVVDKEATEAAEAWLKEERGKIARWNGLRKRRRGGRREGAVEKESGQADWWRQGLVTR